MTALDSIIKWAINDLPEWQCDAVRRLLTQDKLLKIDEDEILLMLKKINGLEKPEDVAVVPKPLKRGDISGDQVKPVKIILKAMMDLYGVNAIKGGAGLKFGHQGLNVIYGENGAGKSGYARVLKRACNARDVKERILPNVFGDASEGPAKAKFKISVNESPDGEVWWEDGQDNSADSPNILANICVFDSKCANVIVDDNNEATYLPYGAHVFEELASLLKNIKSRLETEKPKPKKLEYSDIVQTTAIGQFISGINYETPIESVEKLAIWTEENEQQLLQVKKRVADAELNDPNKQARKIRNLKGRINNILENIKLVEKTLSQTKTEKIAKAITKLNAAEKALAIASEESLSEEPLPGAGENEWQLLYNAAKEYSLKLAYPGKDFPQVEEGSLCVLCMQPLSQEAQNRVLRFKNFMEDTVKKEVESALNSLQTETKDVFELKIITIDSIKDVLDEIRDRDTKLSEIIEQFFPLVEARAKDIIKSVSNKEVMTYSPISVSPLKSIEELINNLENEAVQIESTANPEELVKIKTQRAELEAKKLFFTRKKDVLTYIEELKLAKKYDSCVAATDTRGVTQKGKTIVSQALTPLLQEALKQELIILGASHLPLNLKPSGAGGETRHKLELNGCQARKVSLSEILSEGEQRVVAIAGFLAELKTGGNECPIVFDDPVSSLDHRYREKIAERIVREAVNRQVLVFTHDIAFLLALRSKTGELNRVSFYPQTVRKTVEFAGQCLDGVPWHAMNVKDRLTFLNVERDTIQPLYVSDIDEYNRRAGHLYGLLRETWEACVEEVLFFETIRRHSGEIQTQRIKSVTVTTEDYKTIHLGMSKCSTWMFGHDKSKALDANRPSPDEIHIDITELKNFVTNVRRRNNELREQREEALEPDTPLVG